MISSFSKKMTELEKLIFLKAATAVEKAKEYTVSGSIVTFLTNLISPIKTKVTLEPVQDLHGYENPWPAGGGKNLLPLTLAGLKTANTTGVWNENVYTMYNVTFTVLTDDGGNVIGIKANGTANANADLLLAPAFTLQSGSYIASNEGSGTSYYGQIENGSAWTGRIVTGTTQTISYSSGTIIYHYYVANGASINNVEIHPMIRLSSVSDATYAPYSNICPISGWDSANVTVSPTSSPDDPDKEVYQITFPEAAGTVYGGTLTVNKDGTGTLVVDMANIASYNGETLPYTWISDRDVYAQGTTPTTGAQVVYELSTPVTYNLTAEQVGQILSLKGVNNVWSDGDVEVTYQKKG